MLASARRHASYADIEALPAHLNGQIIDGELFVTPRPGFTHARSCSRLAAKLISAFDDGETGPGGWEIYFEPELHLGDDVLVPDLAGWVAGRLTGNVAQASTVVPPDWICDVLSPSTQAADRILKLPIYARAGVRWAWLVHPTDHTVETFELRDGAWVVQRAWSANDLMRAVPFAALEIPLRALWRSPPPMPEGPPESGD